MLRKISRIVLGILLFLLLMVAGSIGVIKYNQYQNITTLIEEALDGRLIAHKANHQGKLASIFNSGIRSFELDLMFRQQGDSGYFEVGHDDKEAKGHTFASYLESLGDYTIKKVWIDVKNINDDNASAVLARLAFLDENYDIKPILILESSTTSKRFKDFSRAGYHTSYYLPTTKIHGLLAQNDAHAIQKEVVRIQTLVHEQQLAAVSFTASLYPFVKRYLEPVLPKHIVYHTWNIINFKDYKALETLKDKAIFKDERIQTIIFNYHYIY